MSSSVSTRNHRHSRSRKLQAQDGYLHTKIDGETMNHRSQPSLRHNEATNIAVTVTEAEWGVQITVTAIATAAGPSGNHLLGLVHHHQAPLG